MKNEDIQKKVKFNKICKDIKSLKIQGARNIAKAGFRAYKLVPNQFSRRKILSLRPTEPMLANVLKKADKLSYRQLLEKLKQNQEKINEQIFSLIKNDSIIFTHCHSSTLIDALIYAKNRRKKFEVYNTETRPLFQGRRTFRELKKANISVTMFVDSAAQIALTKSQGTKKVNLVLLGADAITKKGVFNKIGSDMFAQIAKQNRIPVYILTDSLKYSKKPIKIEQRNPKEVWNTDLKIKIKNPAFSLVKKQHINGIISELGTLSYSRFLKKVRKNDLKINLHPKSFDSSKRDFYATVLYSCYTVFF